MSRTRFAFVLLLLGAAAAPSSLMAAQTFPDDDPAEVALWDTIQKRPDAANYRSFLLLYPNGRFAPLARLKLAKLGVAAPPPATPAGPAGQEAAATDAGVPQLYRLEVRPGVVGMGGKVTVTCRGLMPPALYDRIVVVRVGTPDFTADHKVDEGQLLWNGLPNLYDCAGAGIELPMFMKGSYEVRYLSRQYNPEGNLEVVARSGFVYR